MALIALWIDREHAKFFTFSQERMERTHLDARHMEHHNHAKDHNDASRWENKFFADVANRLREASQVLILGPGMAKHHFRTYLMEHVPLVAKAVVGCETVSHPTDPQIAAMASRFFTLRDRIPVG
jgi:stalled ribosome rescue protein Dom34